MVHIYLPQAAECAAQSRTERAAQRSMEVGAMPPGRHRLAAAGVADELNRRGVQGGNSGLPTCIDLLDDDEDDEGVQHPAGNSRKRATARGLPAPKRAKTQSRGHEIDGDGRDEVVILDDDEACHAAEHDVHMEAGPSRGVGVGDAAGPSSEPSPGRLTKQRREAKAAAAAAAAAGPSAAGAQCQEFDQRA